MRKSGGVALATALSGAILAIGGCDEEERTQMDDFAGAWRATSVATTANSCPWIAPEGSGWYLLIDRTDEDRAVGKGCADAAGSACTWIGPVVLSGDVAMASGVREWGDWRYDCVVTSVSAGLLTLTGEGGLSFEQTIDTVKAEGEDCAEYEDWMQIVSGRDLPMVGCRIDQSIQLSRD